MENDDDKIEIPEGWKLVGFVGVDSGQVIICDPCYLPERRPALEQMCGRHEAEWIDGSDGAGDEDLHAPKFAGEFSYRGVCSTTMHFGAGQLYYRMGHAGAGVASNTMIGDGTYPVFAQISPKGEIHGLIIRFDIAKMDLDHDGIKYDVPEKRTEQVERAEAIAAKRQQALEDQYNKLEEAAERAEALLKKHEGGEK